MNAMPAYQRPPSGSRRAALIVLALALAATLFGVWREHEIARRGQIIRWQDGFAQINPMLQQALSQRFETMRDQAKATLRRQNYSERSWEEFLKDSEWKARFPGMMEIGYAKFSPNGCIVQFVSTRTNAPIHAPGADLDNDPIVRETIQKTADAGYGIGSRPFVLPGAAAHDVFVLGVEPLPFRDMRPAAPSENRTNLNGFVFFVLNQQEYFQFVQKQFKSLAFDLRLLSPDEPTPARTETQRPFTVTNLSGEWHLLATIKPPPAAASAPQWIVLAGGLALSFLLYSLFSTQSRLRREAELANEKILMRDSEITALNRDLEQKVATRTAELNDALAAEKELNRLKSNFISMVTHEIRTPLALILGSSEILSRYLDRLAPEKRAEHLATIDSAVGRMSALIEDVLLFSRAEAGRIEFHPSPIDLRIFSTKLVDELLSATKRRCPIDLSVGDITEPARGDEHLLRHILANLISNAVKYSAEGATVNLSVSRENGDAVFVVRDHGMGIPGEDQKRLFTPFYRSKNVATIRGTGLGLIIVKHCVERHGGQLKIESVEKVGTTVTVRMPLFSPAHTEFLRKINPPENPPNI